jgi:hypothetical protein
MRESLPIAARPHKTPPGQSGARKDTPEQIGAATDFVENGAPQQHGK